MIIAMAIFGYWLMCHQDIPENHIAGDEYKALMKYHGASVLYEDYNGNLWFVRDGKRIYVHVNRTARTKTRI